MALQLALTTLESVAVMLNERKRESEQSAAFHAKLRNGGSKLVGAKAEAGARVLLREDDVQQLEFNSLGQVPYYLAWLYDHKVFKRIGNAKLNQIH